MIFYGQGIINESDAIETLVAANSGREIADSGRLYFLNSSSAGSGVVIINQGSTTASVAYGGSTDFGTPLLLALRLS
jgi:hypothetical protein